MSGGAGFLPSTVSLVVSKYNYITMKSWLVHDAILKQFMASEIIPNWLVPG